MEKRKNIAVMFDVDGVIAETPHEEAWKDAAVEWGIIEKAHNFTSFYSKHVAGEPGLIGAMNILENLKDEKEGSTNYFEREKIPEHKKKKIADRFRDPVKQCHVDRYISMNRYRAFSDIIDIIHKLEGKVTLCAVSSSENARNILHSLTLLHHFDVLALGARSHWSSDIEKINHYAMAYGKALQHSRTDRFEKVIVFEDAPKGISAVRELGFVPIGISRRSTTGKQLISKEELIENGALFALDEEDLKNFDIKSIIGGS
jgi:beta-phosphoglucomutase-like phosphatase (HAD superfamily)